MLPWSPSQPNGWYPRLSPNGQYVAYGFGGVWITDLTTGETHEYPGGYAPQWIQPNVVTFGVPLTNNTATRCEVAVGDWTRRDMLDDPARVAANTFDANGGHWMANLAGQRVVIDGQIVEQGRVWGADIKGAYALYGHAEAGTARVVEVTPPFTLVREIRADYPVLHRDGHVAYGVADKRVSLDTGDDFDITASPTNAEGSPYLFTAEGVLWIATTTEVGGQGAVLLRPVQRPGTDFVIVIPYPAVAVHAVQVGDQLRVAMCGDRGQMQVQDVPLTSARVRIPPWVPPFPRPFYLGAFFAFANEPGSGLLHPYGSTPDYPQNITVVVNPEVVALAARYQPLIVPSSQLMLMAVRAAGVQDRVRMLYIGSETGAPQARVDAREAKANWTAIFGTPPPPVLWYITPGEPRRSDWFVPDDVDVLAPQFYFDEFTAKQTRMTELLWRMLGNWITCLGVTKPWMPICQAFDRASKTVDMRAIAAMQPAFLSQMITLDRRIGVLPPAIGLLFFAVNRPGGAYEYPRIRAWHQAMFDALPPGVPSLPTPEPRPIPKPLPKPQPKPEPVNMDKIPSITDDEIIELAEVYDSGPPQATKIEYAYLRDGAYYGIGYMRLRAMGTPHAKATEFYRAASDIDGYYSVPLRGGIPDDDVIALQERWTTRYKMLGRYQRQSRKENVRDLTYWLIVYARTREAGRVHEYALRAMETAMAAEAGEPNPYPVVPDEAPELVAAGQIFRTKAGEPFRIKGVSGFRLPSRFAAGEDIDPFLNEDYGKCNMVRAWDYVPWPTGGWDTIGVDGWAEFLKHLKSQGKLCEITLLTDDNRARIEPARQLVLGLANHKDRPTNLLVEIGNEPTTNKNIDTAALRGACEASGFLYCSGDYEDSNRWFGTYYTCHTARTRDWSRRAHDLMEFYDGSGPDKETKPHRVPCLGDEPGKVQDVGRILKDWRAYFGGCSIMGAGATIHLETGKQATRPTDEERPCITAALEGLNAFSADARISGAYRRIVEPGNEQGGPTEDSRTYVVGPYMVRSQQVGTATLELGWVALDGDGVLFRRST